MHDLYYIIWWRKKFPVLSKEKPGSHHHRRKHFDKFSIKFSKPMPFFFFLVTPIFPVSWSESVTCKMLGIFWKNPSLPEFNSITEHTTVYFDFTGPAKSASTTKWLLWITSFNSIYIHVLLLKNMEGSQRSQFKDNFQVNIE